MLKLGRGAAVEPEVDLAGYWVDGDVVHVGRIRIGAGARVGARSTLMPGARVGKGAEIVAGSTVRGAVPAGQRWSGSPARRVGKSALSWPASRPPRSRLWVAAYGVTATLLGLLPGDRRAARRWPCSARRRLGAPTRGRGAARRAAGRPARHAGLPARRTRLLVLVGVRLLARGLVAGYHPVHSRLGWQVWATERLMGLARVGLYPLYASLFTARWLRLLGATIGREVEASTVIALPSMTTVADGAFLADDTMVGTYELAGGWLHVAPSRIGKRAFLGNSGMTAPGRSVPKRGLVGVLSAAPAQGQEGLLVPGYAADAAAPGRRAGRRQPHLRARRGG